MQLSFMQEAEQHMLLGRDRGIAVACPARIMHGLRDTVVPCTVASQLLEQLQASDVQLTLVKVCAPAFVFSMPHVLLFSLRNRLCTHRSFIIVLQCI